MQETLHLLQLVAPSEATVLLLGETGTGKELAAKAIHRNSPRAQGPFVVLNCAALPETLLESELFGHEKGAFTGAISRHDGRFVKAHRGVLFLDEVGELSLTTQVKILRVLQHREFEPLGSDRTLKVDVRLIAATNRNLEAMVREGRFRDDLFYRLNVFPITMPPLRARTDDLPELARHFLKRFARQNRRPVCDLAPDVLEAFRRYAWPGNIRELENVMERGVIICQRESLSLADLPPVFRPKPPPQPEAGEPDLLELERQLIRRTLEKVAGRRQDAAAILGISLEELNFKLRSYDIKG
jgi:transcriptional regulator with GAF, ATPase, and Fis domain